MQPLTEAVGNEPARVIVRRIAEPIQESANTMVQLRRVGAIPGSAVMVQRTAGGISIGSAGEYTELSEDLAQHLLVQAPE